MISARTRICMVIGDPVEHSLSPLIHNTGYKAAGLDGSYVYVGCRVAPEQMADFVAGIRTMGVRGVSCTMPHKEIIMPYLDVIDPVAAKIGAVNTIVQGDGKLFGYNTDWIGIVAPLMTLGPLEDKRVVVLGAGGAARAMVYGLVREGAFVTVCNRTVGKAEALAADFDCHAAPLDASDVIQEADIICNATTVGMHPRGDESPIDTALIGPRHMIFDAVYAPYDTRLIRDAKAAGARVIHGTEMLLHQGFAQFKLFTGQEPPEDAIREALLRHVLGMSS